MNDLGAIAATIISLIFLGIVLTVAGVAIPGLFMAVVAPWLERIFPARDK